MLMLQLTTPILYRQPANISASNNRVESMDSLFTWVACSHPAANAAPISNVAIGFASSTISALSRIWKDKRLTTATKVHLYQALVMSVLLYAAETWTLLAANLRSLEAFHQYEMPATDLRYSLDWPYLQRACPVACRSRSRQSEKIASHWHYVAIFGHIARLGEELFQSSRLSELTSTYHLIASQVGTGNVVLVYQTIDRSIRFVTTAAACPGLYDQPSLVAMAQE